MSRLKRFEEFRFVGARDSMIVYDTDDGTQSDLLAGRLEANDLLNRTLIQTFGPDTVDEARNRGFSQVRL